MDGYDLTTETVFEYQGCHCHGCRRCFPNARDEIINHNQTQENGFLATVERTRALRAAGFLVIEKWECDDRKTQDILPKQETRTYPYSIFYDFESYHDKTRNNAVTASLTYENEPTHICDANPKELIRKFMEELERRGKNIRSAVRAEFMPGDIALIPGKQRRVILEWCDQVPVLGFNCGRYDLNLIKEHFAELLADTTTKVQVGSNTSKTMFMKTNGFCFVDLINYLGPDTSYDKWVKACGCSAQKSGFPYEWFDSPEKLNYLRLPDHPAWYSRRKGAYVLSLSEYKECKKIFKEKGMQTFADWLRSYIDLDAASGLEALEKMRAFYTDKGIDILKDAVSVSGVSLHYLLRGTIERGAELNSPCKEAYGMLKEAVVGGQSLVFTRYHEAGVTRIRPYNNQEFVSELLATTLTRSTCQQC